MRQLRKYEYQIDASEQEVIQRIRVATEDFEMHAKQLENNLMKLSEEADSVDHAIEREKQNIQMRKSELQTMKDVAQRELINQSSILEARKNRYGRMLDEQGKASARQVAKRESLLLSRRRTTVSAN